MVRHRSLVYYPVSLPAIRLEPPGGALPLLTVGGSQRTPVEPQNSKSRINGYLESVEAGVGFDSEDLVSEVEVPADGLDSAFESLPAVLSPLELAELEPELPLLA